MDEFQGTEGVLPHPDWSEKSVAPEQKELPKGALNGDCQVRTKWQPASYLPTPQVRGAPATGKIKRSPVEGVHVVAFPDVHSVNMSLCPISSYRWFDNCLATFYKMEQLAL